MNSLHYIWTDSTNSYANLGRQTIKLNRGLDYELSFWIKHTEVPNNITVLSVLIDFDGAWDGWTKTVVEIEGPIPTSNWRKEVVHFTNNHSESFMVYTLRLIPGNYYTDIGVVEVWIDDVQLIVKE
jgi:hypothetical protein